MIDYVILDQYLMNFTKGQVVSKELLASVIDPEVIPTLVKDGQIRKATAAEGKAGFVVIEEPNPQADTLTDTSGELYQDYREAQATKQPVLGADAATVSEIAADDGGSDSGDENKTSEGEEEANKRGKKAGK